MYFARVTIITAWLKPGKKQMKARRPIGILHRSGSGEPPHIGCSNQLLPIPNIHKEKLQLLVILSAISLMTENSGGVAAEHGKMWLYAFNNQLNHGKLR